MIYTAFYSCNSPRRNTPETPGETGAEGIQFLILATTCGSQT